MKARAEREQRSGTQLLRLSLAVVIGAGTVFVAFHDWLGLGPSSLDYAAEGPVYDAVIVAAGLTCLLRSLSVREERGAWIAIGLGILAWGAAEVYWTTTILNDPSPPYPSPADVGYLALLPVGRASGSRFSCGRARARSSGACGWTGRSPRWARRRSAPPSSSTSSSPRPKALRCRWRPRSPIHSATSFSSRASSGSPRSPVGGQAAPGRCCWSASPPSPSPTSPTPCRKPTSDCRKGPGSIPST